MPTDLDRWKAFLNSFRIKFDDELNPRHHYAKCQRLTIREGQEKVDGYNGFLFVVDFDENGNFLKMGIYEE